MTHDLLACRCDCHNGWQRPCDVPGGCGIGAPDTGRVCVLCANRNPPRVRKLETGHVCDGCRRGLAADLAQILDLVALIGRDVDPLASRGTSQGGRPHPGSRPPLDVTRLDPELILVRIVPGDRSSDTALLVLLEDWCRLIREERGFAPYGIATEDQPESVTLAGAIAFLRAQVDYCCDEPTFSLEQFASNLRRALGTLRAHDPSRGARGWGIPCPADTGEDACRRLLHVERHDDGRLDLHTDIHCPGCGTTWTAQRLLLVALADQRVTIWAYPSEIGDALAIPVATLRQWHARGHVARIGGRYDAGAAFRRRHAIAERA